MLSINIYVEKEWNEIFVYKNPVHYKVPSIWKWKNRWDNKKMETNSVRHETSKTISRWPKLLHHLASMVTIENIYSVFLSRVIQFICCLQFSLLPRIMMVRTVDLTVEPLTIRDSVEKIIELEANRKKFTETDWMWIVNCSQKKRVCSMCR